jgi:transcriptional regulator with XRE-family HTH domain
VAPRSEFGQYLERLLEKRGLSGSAFARKVGISTSFLRWTMVGQKPVPGPRIDAWADALDLTGRERDRFVEAAWLTHAPPFVVALVKRLRRQK